ncbi:MAG: sigma 54-interacting transcriptional regulator, partial [Proteobacteria bacterium]|nr:sigma 54-interacting transcriptional regulator [Pseudomonadota bacterium]
EIAELPLSLQTKLLRVLQERCFEPIGSHRSVPLQARVISATNLNLELLVAEGRFRQDLYFRLKMAHLEIPPLRCRQEDIGILCKYLLKRACIELSRPLVTLSKEAQHCLCNQPWPGNVRELEHLLKRALLETRGQQISAITIQSLCEDNPKTAAVEAPVTEEELRSTMRQLLERQAAHPSGSAAADSTFHQIIQKLEQILIEEALTKTSGNQLAASKMLGLHRTTLRKKIGL